MPRAVLAICLLSLLAACGTPQERCIARETRDLRAVNRQIAEAEGNLARGHALVTVTVYEDYWGYCPVRRAPAIEGGPMGEPTFQLCLKERPVTETRARRIDPAAERQRLEGLEAQRRILDRAAGTALERCREAFPE